MINRTELRASFPFLFTLPVRGLASAALLVGLLAMAGCVSGAGKGTSTGSGASALIPEGVPRTDRVLADSAEDFQFAIVADRTGGHRPGIFAKAIEQVNRLGPAFVLSVGDLIEGYTEDPAKIKAEWDEIDSMLDVLEMPFFYTVGNHDVSNPPMLDAWRSRHGRDYWAFVYKDVLFLSLSTEDPPIELSADIIARKARFERLMNEDPEKVQRMIAARASQGALPELPTPIAISDEQVAFVEETLSNHADVRWTILLMHKPAWKEKDPAFLRIESMLGDRDYTVIAGHEHTYQHMVRNDRDYLVLGTTGGVWLSQGPGAMDHVMWGTMTDEGPTLVPLRLEGILEVEGP
ncbi:MAG: metallophosphoesterase [Myxococcota bacterium]